jgi:hypothetical protein
MNGNDAERKKGCKNMKQYFMVALLNPMQNHGAFPIPNPVFFLVVVHVVVF